MLTIGFGAAGILLSFVYPWIIGCVVDIVTSPERLGAERVPAVAKLAAAALLTALLQAGVVYGRGHCNVELGHSVVVDLRRDLFNHLHKLSNLFFSKERTGSILARLIQDVHEATALIYTGVLVAVLDAAQLGLAVALLLRINNKLTSACLLLFPLYVLVFAALNHRVRDASDRMQTRMTRIIGHAGERISGQALVKSFTSEAREGARFADDLLGHHTLVLAQSHEGHLVAALGELLINFGTTIVIGYGGWLAIGGEISAGTMTRFLGLVLLMFGPLRRFAELNIVYQSSLSAIRRVFRLLDVEPGVCDPTFPRVTPPHEGHVRFDAVWFRFPSDSGEALVGLETDERERTARAPERPITHVLEGVTLEAHPGELIAIVGPSGAGKTTLVSLLPRFHDVTHGSVSIDGTDVRTYSLRALRSSIGIVQQETFLFTGTVRENLAYGSPQASNQEIERAAKAAYADEFIERLPAGYETTLGERGVNLSGGQRQRISIARAILKNPRILILDEATSSLDAESEAIVQQAIRKLLCSRTCLVIAHRLSTIQCADRIFVVDRGKVVEDGDYNGLIARDGTFARLVRHQSR